MKFFILFLDGWSERPDFEPFVEPVELEPSGR
jgi:hypothetical protein